MVINLLLILFCIGQIFAATCGDVNNDEMVDIVDALLIAQDYVDLNPVNFDSTVADVNGDSAIDIIDALLVAQFYVDLIPSLPGCVEPTTPPVVTSGPSIEPTSPPMVTPDPNEGLVAFPGAEGWGKHTVGGRGGIVCEVTNLNDDGPGSLREALDADGPKTIVFRVGGTIELQSAIRVDDYTTIAGQTAPGDGICIKGWPFNINGTQIIIRYIRVRLGDGTGYENDAVHCSTSSNNMMLDHISASWSVDETFSVYNTDTVTIQWCMIAESLNNSIHPKGEHGYGGLWGGQENTHHHNLFAHHKSRNPRFKDNSDFRNNVVYNWLENSSYGGSDSDVFNMVANYYKPGPATPAGELQYRIVEPYGGQWYITDNFVYGNPAVTIDNWDGGVQGDSGTKVDTPFEFVPINQQSAEDAFESVLQYVGCSFPNRDAIDARIVQEVRDGTATYGTNGIIDRPSDVGGWPELKSGPAPLDSDHDGMPDIWEQANGLNPHDASDGNDTDAIGYTNLERYINSLVQW